MDKQQEKIVKTQIMTEGKEKHRFTRTNTLRIPNRKIPVHDGIHVFWLKKFTSIHDKVVLKMNRFLHESRRT